MKRTGVARCSEALGTRFSSVPQRHSLEIGVRADVQGQGQRQANERVGIGGERDDERKRRQRRCTGEAETRPHGIEGEK